MAMNKMLGKRPAMVDTRNLKLIKYLPPELPPVPPAVHWYDVKCANSWGMDGNDKYGNCVIVTAAHIIDCSRSNESLEDNRLSDEEVIKLSTEMGALDGYWVLERLKWWRQRGMWGTKITAFCDVDVDHDLLRSAINIFGHADIGLSMPMAWESTDVWDTGNGWKFQKGSWGGHSVPLIGYETRGSTIIYYLCTWGHIGIITSQAIDAYCDEAYVSILPEWYARDQITPSNFNLQQLQFDLAQIEAA